MRPENTEVKKNQAARFARRVIFLALFILAAAAGATLYQESKPNLPTPLASVAPTRSEPGIEVDQAVMQGEPFSHADGVNSISPQAAPIKKGPPDPVASAYVQGYSATERQSMNERFDHSVVNQRSTAHHSDSPGASIAAY